MRLGFLGSRHYSAAFIGAWSGLPFFIHRALSAANIELADLGSDDDEAFNRVSAGDELAVRRSGGG